MLAVFWQYQFIQNAVLAGLLASIVCGIIGVIVMEKRLVMLSGGIAHTSYGGIGLGYFLGFEPIWGAFLISSLAALGVGIVKRQTSTAPDVLIGLFWSVGMALGILFIAFTPGYPPDVTSYLFGSILAVRRLELLFMAVLTALVFVCVAAFFKYWKLYLFDEEFAALRGVKVVLMEYILYLLIALAVVVLIRVVGIILVLALLTAPPVIARKFTADLRTLMVYAVMLGAFFSFCGLWLSYELNIPSGATIILLAGFTYLLVSVATFFFKSKGGQQRSNEADEERVA